MKYNLIVITGPTASGKTALAVKLADILNTEIISADSRQVYRGLDIGTGKDLHEYTVKGRNIPYHLIDIVNPSEDFDLFKFYKSFFELFKDFQKKKSIPILAGGSTLYIHSVLANYKMLEVPPNEDLRKKLESYSDEKLINYLKTLEPNLHNTTDFENRYRLLKAIEIALYKREHPEAKSPGEGADVKPFILGTRWEPHILRRRIKKRLTERLNEGMVEEVKILQEKGSSWERLEYFGLEYRYISLYLQEKISYGEMVDTLFKKICQFAKRQRTWFRKMEREGFKIHWVDNGDFNRTYKLVKAAGF